MIPLLKMYDDVTSNKYTSLGITAASTAFTACRIYGMYYSNFFSSPLIFVISACAGVTFALLTKTYIIYNERVKTEGGRNRLYATLSLFVAFTPINKIGIFKRLFENPIRDFIYPYELHRNELLCGFGIGFLVTNLALQLLEGKTKFKFQSPFVFE